MIEINEVEYCKLAVKFEAGIDLIQTKKNEVVSKFKNHKVPGFRPGKATSEAIRIHFKKEINEALKQELADEAFNSVIFEKNIKPFGNPDFTSINLDGGKFACEFSLHKRPDFELKEYKDFEIPKPGELVSTEELSQKMIQELRTRHGETKPFEENEFIQMEDSVIIDYSGTVDNLPIEDLNVSGEIITIGKTRIPHFDENLLGMKLGEERSFEVNIPEGSNIPTIAGKNVTFKVTLVMGSKVTPAPLDNEFAQKLGFETYESLSAHVTSTASTRVKELEKSHITDQLSRRLIANHDFKIPEWISLEEAKINARNGGADWEKLTDDQKEKFLEQSSNNVKLSLILEKIREIEPDTQLSDEEVFELAKANIAKFSKDTNEVLNNIFKNGHMPILFNRIRDEHTLDFIGKSIKIVE